MFEGQMTGKSRRETELQWCLLGVWCVVSTAVFGGLLLVVERVGEKTAKDGVKEPPVNSSEGAVECLQGEKDFLKFLLLSLRTQVSLTVPHIHHPPLPPSPPPPPSPFLPSPPLSLSSHQHHQPCAGIFTTSLLHLLVAGLLHGVLLTLLLRCTYNKQPSKPFKFGEDLLIEEVNMSSSQKLTLLQFKIQKVSTEPLNNISITAFFCPPSTGQHKQTTNTRHSASFEACPSLLTEESPDLQEHKLHLSSDKKISSQSNFYIFPWPCVCYHQVRYNLSFAYNVHFLRFAMFCILFSVPLGLIQ